LTAFADRTARTRSSSGLGLLSSAKLDDVASSRRKIASLTIIFHLPMRGEKIAFSLRQQH
jgi:hypothetical protein